MLDFRLKLTIGGGERKDRVSGSQQQSSLSHPKLNPTHTSVNPIDLNRINWDWVCVGVSCAIAACTFHPQLHQQVESIIQPIQLDPPKQEQKQASQGGTINPTQSTPIKTGQQIKHLRVSSGWGKRKKPCAGCSTYHHAVDLALPENTPLTTPVDTIAWEVNHKGIAGRGCYILVNDVVVQNLHSNQCFPGPKKAGEVFGLTGDAGTGPHAHIAVFQNNGTSDDPIKGRRLTEVPSEELLLGLFPKDKL